MGRADPRALRLQARGRGKTAVLSIRYGDELVPLLRLSNPSAAFNVMSLDVRHRSRWAPTFHRGIPQALADVLTQQLAFTWATWVDDAEWSETSDHEH